MSEIGVLIQDHKGQVMVAQCLKEPTMCNVESEEIIAAMRALKFANDVTEWNIVAHYLAQYAKSVDQMLA